MPFGAPPIGGLPVATPMGALLGGGIQPPGASGDATRAENEGVAAEIRRIVEQMRGAADQMDALAAERPTLAPAAEQFRALADRGRTMLVQAMIDLARQTPEQTVSSLAIPTSGGGL